MMKSKKYEKVMKYLVDNDRTSHVGKAQQLVSSDIRQVGTPEMSLSKNFAMEALVNVEVYTDDSQ